MNNQPVRIQATPRPWRIYDFEGRARVFPKNIIESPTGESIAEIRGGWPQCSLAENEANASLIVKAVNTYREWQPIASAPKDCSWILGAMLSGRQAVVRYNGNVWEDDNRLCRNPQFWQPLPDSPSEAAK